MKIEQTATILILVIVHFASGFLRVCYYTNWSQYRPDGGKFTPDHVNPALCSHLIYAFAKLDGNTLTAYEWNDDPTGFSIGMYAKINNMKKQHPHLKTLLAVGGWNAGSALFSNISRLASSRQEFVNNTQHFLRGRNFDGLDIDWEYPTQRGGRPEDKQNYVLLLKDLASAFEHDAYHTGRPKLLLSAAVPAGKEHIDSGFDIPNLARSLDFISVMTYDLHGSWESRTGHNSPLLPRANEFGAETFMNTEWALNHWAKMGAPKYKLLVGLGLYGRSFKLANPLNNGIGALAVGAGRMGNFTKEDGFMAYYEVCKELSNGGVRVWNPEHKVPYMYKGDLWVGYDDEQSVREKVHWTKQNGFGGMMVWSLALDDFNGRMCNKGPYPLLTTINNEYKKTVQPKKIQFIDPTPSGINAFGGSVISPTITLLKDPPLAQAFEHTHSSGHSHHAHSPPILTNLSGIDIQQLSSMPQFNLLDHLPSGNALVSLPKTTSKPKVVVPSGSAVPPQMSLTELISQLIHAPGNHLHSGHHDHLIGVPNLPQEALPAQLSINAAPSAPTLKTAPTGRISNSAVSSPKLPNEMPSVGAPENTATLTDLLGSGLLPATLLGGTKPVSNAGQNIHIVDNSHHNPAIGHLTALGNIGVLPAVGRLGGVGHNGRGHVPNISFSSKSNNTSSSSSSTSSSQSNSRNVSFGVPDQTSGRLNLQDVLQSGRPNLPTSLLGNVDPLVGLSHGSSMPGDSILSVLDGGSIELPSGSVGTVIPISNNDNLAQILSSLGVQLPTSGSVLLPEETRSLTPDSILDELTIGNLKQPLSSNIIPSAQQPLPSNMFPSVLQPQPNNLISTAQQSPITSADRVLEELSLGNLFQPRAGNSIVPVQQMPIASSRAASMSFPAMQRPNAIQTPRTLQSSSFAQTGINRPADPLIQRSTLSRPNTQQRRRVSLADLRRLLERRRLVQALRRQQSQLQSNRNRVADTNNNLIRQTRQRRPNLSQQRFNEPAVSRQRLIEPATIRQRFTEPAVRLQRFNEPATIRQRFTEPAVGQQRFNEPATIRQRFTEPAVNRQRFTQPAVSRQQIQRLPSLSQFRQTQPQLSNSLIQRTRQQSPRSRSGITLLNSGNLPPQIQRLFANSASSFVPSSRF